LVLLSAAACGPQAKQAASLSPEDLGAKKYVFQALAPKGSVVVFRQEEYSNADLVRRYETISNTPREKHVENVLFIDWTILRGRTTYTLKTDTGGGELTSVVWRGSQFSEKPPKFEIVFEETKDGKGTHIVRTFIFSMANEKYEDVKKRIPALPNDPLNGWTYSQPYYFSAEK